MCERELLAFDGQLVGAGWCDSGGMEWVSDKWWQDRRDQGGQAAGPASQIPSNETFCSVFILYLLCLGPERKGHQFYCPLEGWLVTRE